MQLNVHDFLENFTSANVWNDVHDSTGDLATTVRRNQLMVTGDAGDKVVLTDLANWTAAGAVITINNNTYTGYNHNSLSAQLLIDTALTVSAS